MQLLCTEDRKWQAILEVPPYNMLLSPPPLSFTGNRTTFSLGSAPSWTWGLASFDIRIDGRLAGLTYITLSARVVLENMRQRIFRKEPFVPLIWAAVGNFSARYRTVLLATILASPHCPPPHLPVSLIGFAYLTIYRLVRALHKRVDGRESVPVGDAHLPDADPRSGVHAT